MINRSNVGNYVNIYSPHDWVQPVGGGGPTRGYSRSAGFYDLPRSQFDVGVAGRTDPQAFNIGIVNQWNSDTGKIENLGHSDLHTPSVFLRAMESFEQQGRAP